LSVDRASPAAREVERQARGTVRHLELGKGACGPSGPRAAGFCAFCRLHRPREGLERQRAAL